MQQLLSLLLGLDGFQLCFLFLTILLKTKMVRLLLIFLLYEESTLACLNFVHGLVLLFQSIFMSGNGFVALVLKSFVGVDAFSFDY